MRDVKQTRLLSLPDTRSFNQTHPTDAAIPLSRDELIRIFTHPGAPEGVCATPADCLYSRRADTAEARKNFRI